MTQRFSAPVWLIWAASTAFIVLVTRNPLYLSLVALAVLTVYLCLERRSPIALAWGTVLRIGLVIASISVLFNLLTVSAGDRQFSSLPESWPIIGGALTWNAAAYGSISGLALMSLLLIAATLSSAVDRSALVRMVPDALGSTGIAAAAALSIFPQTIQAIGQVREAHHARGLRLRSIRSVQRLIIPVLNIGLERAFSLAESMESRAFGNRARGMPISPWQSVSVLGLLTLAIVLFGIGYAFPAMIVGVLALVLVGFLVRRGQRSASARYRKTEITRLDIPVLASSMAVVIIVGAELFGAASSLNYSTYPRLAFPDFSVLVGVACVLTALPAILPASVSISETANA